MAAQVFNDRYEIQQHIARGGMAEVYLAHDRLLDRPVALKVLFPEFAADQSFVERFRREARAAANLNHPGIVSVYDWGEEDGTYFIVMEYAEGRTLRDIIRGEAPLLPERAAEIGADIAAALAFAHRNGVIHRDVKPGNVIISPTGQVKVTDFGIARAGDPGESLTQTGAVMGTATYFSPEQAQGGNIDPRSDVYSLGVVLYEMVVGRAPFTGDNPVSIAYQHVRETPDAPSQHNPDVPPAFEAVVLKAMAKNPANRYASADDLRADLMRFCAGEPVVAEPLLAPPADVTQVVGATRVQPIADGTTVLPAAGAGAVALEERPARTGTYIILLAVLLLLLAGLLFLLARELGVFGSSSSTQVDVPNVINQPEADAVKALSDRGLKVDRKTANNDSVQSGLVAAQNPDPGTRLHTGDTVHLTISTGAPQVVVPDVTGRDDNAAFQVLTQAGLTVATPTQQFSDQPPGTVLSQDPPPGAKVANGTQVKLVVSRGTQPTTTTSQPPPTTPTTEAATTTTEAPTTTRRPTTTVLQTTTTGP